MELRATLVTHAELAGALQAVGLNVSWSQERDPDPGPGETETRRVWAWARRPD